MRYPGVTRQEKVLRSALFLVAILLFGLASTIAVKKRFVAASYLRPQPTPTYAGAASPSPSGSVSLKLFDATTNEPITNQSVAFIVTSTCDSAALSCPTSSPIVLTTDDEGALEAPQSLVLQKPKLYAAGYKTDRYFTFLSSDPMLATVYYPPADAKPTYLITAEIVPVGLQPATP